MARSIQACHLPIALPHHNNVHSLTHPPLSSFPFLPPLSSLFLLLPPSSSSLFPPLSSLVSSSTRLLNRHPSSLAGKRAVRSSTVLTGSAERTTACLTFRSPAPRLLSPRLLLVRQQAQEHLSALIPIVHTPPRLALLLSSPCQHEPPSRQQRPRPTAATRHTACTCTPTIRAPPRRHPQPHPHPHRSRKGHAMDWLLSDSVRRVGPGD